MPGPIDVANSQKNAAEGGTTSKSGVIASGVLATDLGGDAAGAATAAAAGLVTGGATFVIRESAGTYALRATGAAGASATSTVFYIGVDAPTIGTGAAINDVDMWIPTSV